MFGLADRFLIAGLQLYRLCFSPQGSRSEKEYLRTVMRRLTLLVVVMYLVVEKICELRVPLVLLVIQ
ncbi:hypothetical protein D3C75_910400 [compost metagenome]